MFIIINKIHVLNSWSKKFIELLPYEDGRHVHFEGEFQGNAHKDSVKSLSTKKLSSNWQTFPSMSIF